MDPDGIPPHCPVDHVPSFAWVFLLHIGPSAGVKAQLKKCDDTSIYPPRRVYLASIRGNAKSATLNEMVHSDHEGFRDGILLLALLSLPIGAFGGAFMLPPEIASQYSLSTSTSLPFPSTTQSNSSAQNILAHGWSLNKGQIQGNDHIAFVSDPFPDYQLPSSTLFPSPSGPVLQVTYPQGGFGSHGSGTQFYSIWNSTGDPFRTVLLTYEVAFDSTFEWVKGGKLPGLRGGPDAQTCDGGSASDGTCFSTRIMWRKSGDGEGTYTPRCFVSFPNSGCSIVSLRIHPDAEQPVQTPRRTV